MEKEAHHIYISDSIGEVSAEVMCPDKPHFALVLAHGAGAGMNHRFMIQLSEALVEKNIATLRYNFPYMEKKQKRPDAAPVAEKTVGQVLEKAKSLFPGLPLFAGGKSFGGRMTSQRLSKGNNNSVQGIIFFGFPLHPAGAPDVKRAEHLTDISLPMLFLQGTCDALAELSLVKKTTESLKSSTLVLLEGADHSFKSGKKEFIPELSEEAKKWMEKLK
jgi:predicted alpha/beta-hydrolase family hydrolase